MHAHEDERGPGLEEVGVGWRLRRVQHERTVLVDGVRVVQLERTLAHVHSVCGESLTDEPDARVSGSFVGRAAVRRRGDGDVEGCATVGDAVGHT